MPGVVEFDLCGSRDKPPHCDLLSASKRRLVREEKFEISHTVWDCKYHVVWIPKYRRKVLYGKIRHYLFMIKYDALKSKIIDKILIHTQFLNPIFMG